METINENRLWQSVVLTAVKDALFEKTNHSKYSSKDAQDARNWLLYNNSSFFKVCLMANLNPVALREKIIKALDSNNHTSVTKGQKASFLDKKMQKLHKFIDHKNNVFDSSITTKQQF